MLLGAVPSHRGDIQTCHATISEMGRCRPSLNNTHFWVWRHPLSRLVSLYEYAKNGGNNGHEPGYAWVTALSFDQFVRKLVRVRSETLGMLPGIFKPQAHWVEGGRKVGTCHVLNLHNLAADWTRLRTRLSRLPQTALGSQRVTLHGPWCAYYKKSATLSAALRLYKQDFALVADIDVRRIGSVECPTLPWPLF